MSKPLLALNAVSGVVLTALGLKAMWDYIAKLV